MGPDSLFRDLNLTQKQRIYVESRLRGMSRIASATAAGYVDPKTEATNVEQSPVVQEAIARGMQKSAEEVGFTRKEAHDLFIQAYYNADTAMEQIAAARELVKLHGVAAPQQVEVSHTHVHEGELHLLPNDELMKLAEMGNELTLEGEFRVIEEQQLIEHQEPEAKDGYAPDSS